MRPGYSERSEGLGRPSHLVIMKDESRLGLVLGPVNIASPKLLTYYRKTGSIRGFSTD